MLSNQRKGLQTVRLHYLKDLLTTDSNPALHRKLVIKTTHMPYKKTDGGKNPTAPFTQVLLYT